MNKFLKIGLFLWINFICTDYLSFPKYKNTTY